MIAIMSLVKHNRELYSRITKLELETSCTIMSHKQLDIIQCDVKCETHARCNYNHDPNAPKVSPENTEITL